MKYGVRIIKNTYHPLKVPANIKLEHNQMVLVETEKGLEAFHAVLVNDEIAKQWEKSNTQALPLVRIMNAKDIETLEENKKQEIIALAKCKQLVENRKLVMNLTQARYTFDKRKITFYYTAPERVDFRELLKDLTQEFRYVRIDLRHIGVRDETSILQGEGICGQNYCCCRFLKKFEQVNTKLARDQGLPITPSKITGGCGRLLCCLNYEHKNYIENAKHLAPVGSSVMTPDGVGKVCSLNVLYKKVNVKFEDGKIKEFLNSDIEIIDTDVNIQIDQNDILNYGISDENVDIKSLEDDKNGSTGNI
ncbi:MAG: stage 0 sporulation protein [Cyanobacteria bacterium SIG30]|nr:stage 0 sporulation protein [Cyanobacteria bacterium SIG30]